MAFRGETAQKGAGLCPAVADKQYFYHFLNLPILGDLHKENKRLLFDLHKFSSYNLVYRPIDSSSKMVKIMVNSAQKRHFTIQEKLLICGLLQLFPNIFHIKVRISVKRDADICMTHYHLKSLRIHTTFRHVGTERVSANMGRDLG